MTRPTTDSTADVLLYLSAPQHKRPAVGFDLERLALTPAFDVVQVARLERVARLDRRMDRRAAERLLIDLSWASSNLEGNTYSQLDTQALIEWGQQNKDKPRDEAVMILNHKLAIQILLDRENGPLTIEFLREIHRVLSDARDSQNSKHFLEPKQQGLIREYGDIEISGSSYFPPAALGPQMLVNLERILATANAADPINAAFYLMTRQPYLQPFFDVNKRTSRLAANVPLLNAGLAPFSFVGLERNEYLKAMVAFYELGHETLMQQAFVEAYGVAALHERATTTADRIALVNQRGEIAEQLKQYVLAGQEPTNPILISLLDRCVRETPEPGCR